MKWLISFVLMVCSVGCGAYNVHTGERMSPVQGTATAGNYFLSMFRQPSDQEIAWRVNTRQLIPHATSHNTVYYKKTPLYVPTQPSFVDGYNNQLRLDGYEPIPTSRRYTGNRNRLDARIFGGHSNVETVRVRQDETGTHISGYTVENTIVGVGVSGQFSVRSAGPLSPQEKKRRHDKLFIPEKVLEQRDRR